MKSSYCHALVQTRELDIHGAVVLEHIIALTKERRGSRTPTCSPISSWEILWNFLAGMSR